MCIIIIQILYDFKKNKTSIYRDYLLYMGEMVGVDLFTTLCMLSLNCIYNPEFKVISYYLLTVSYTESQSCTCLKSSSQESQPLRVD